MSDLPIACTLSKADLEKRQGELNTLKQLVREVRYKDSGFALRVDGSTENLMALAHVIAQERLCCRFLQFQLIAEPNAGSLWLEVSGAGHASQFLLEMFGFDQNSLATPTQLKTEFGL